ncbi:hypothetical protein D3C81_226210 [compost metagenome]
MSQANNTATEVAVHQKRFQQLIEDLTGRIGRCVTRDLDKASLLDTTKLRMIGALTEYARKYWEVLPKSHEDKTRLVQWEIHPAHDKIRVLTSVGAFVMVKEGHEVFDHDPHWFRQRRW